MTGPITLPYPPSGNAYWRHVGPRVYVTHEARRYRHTAALAATAQGLRPLEGPVRLRVDVYRPRKVGDLDNTLKVLLDALRGIAFADDSQITTIEAHRHDDKSNPRVMVLVEPASEPDIYGDGWAA